jgi:curved DNA-binding protein
LARKYHPDVSKEKNAEAQFKAMGEAYKVLKDPETRAAYDQIGTKWQPGQEFEPSPEWNASHPFGNGAAKDFHGDAEFSDFFENLFGRNRGRSSSRGAHGGSSPGPDQHAKVLIDLEDAYRGTNRTIALDVTTIDANGRPVHQERVLTVDIPKGIRAGQHLRLAGQGGQGFGAGPPGDLYLEIEFKPDRHFRVDGRDVYFDLPLAPWEAALGASITTSMPDGIAQISIPAGSKAGRKLRLKGKGLPGKNPGDLYAILSIALPPSTTEAEKDAYRAMQKAFDFDARAESKG